MQEAYQKIANPKNVLDAGCGVGRFIYNISKKDPNNNYFGVDISIKNIEEAKRTFQGINFQQMSVEDMDFQDQYFDVIYSRDVLEHVESFEKAFKEMARVLRSGGKLIVKIPAPASEKWLLKIRPTYFEEIHHKRIFEGNQLEDLAIQNDFIITKKQAQAFLDHFYLYFLFKFSKVSESQLSLGHWRDHWTGWLVAPIHAFLKPELVFHTWLKFVPVWLFTLPIGHAINSIGNRYFPKSIYYEFTKKY